MARRCDLTGKGVQTGNNVSHAHNKTRRRFIPNLQKVSLLSETLKRSISMKLSTSALRSIEKRGGLDRYLMDEKDSVLNTEILSLKKQIKRAMAYKAEKN